MDALVCSQNYSTPVEARTLMVTDAAPVKLSVLSQHLAMTMGIVTTRMFSLSNRCLFCELFGKTGQKARVYCKSLLRLKQNGKNKHFNAFFIITIIPITMLRIELLVEYFKNKKALLFPVYLSDS